jgi:hypothetical protein
MYAMLYEAASFDQDLSSLSFFFSIELFVILPNVANFVTVLLEQTLFSFKPLFVTMILFYHDERQKGENKPTNS